MSTIKPIDLIIDNYESKDDRLYDFVPKSFDDYLGQDILKKKLSIYAQAATMRQEALDHMLLFGPPGVGKTTLSTIMAQIMNVGIKTCSGPMLERTGDLVAILSSLEKRDILFIDEIHRMPSHVEEVLYNAMEQFNIDVILGQGAGAKTINLPLNPFTLIGATTKSGSISAPLRSRFGIIERIDFYSEEDLQKIVLQAASFLTMSVDPEAAFYVAKAARGTPRIAKKIIRRIRDLAQVNNRTMVDKEFMQQALHFLGIDNDGLNTHDNMVLRVLVEHFHGGPAALETIAAMTGEDKDTLESVIEPYLMRRGFLEKTSRGRQIPNKILSYLQKKFLEQHHLV